MVPMTLTFAAGFGSPEVLNMFALDEYMSLIFSILLGSSLIFELPVQFLTFFFEDRAFNSPIYD